MKTAIGFPILTACVVCASLSDAFAQITSAPNGNVGIGTTSPQHRLTVGNSSDAAPVTFRSVGENGGAWKGGGAFGGVNATVIMGEVNGQAWLGAHNGKLSAWANLIINRDGGNLGIGNASPDARLVVEATGGEPAGTAKFYAPSKGSLASHVHFGGTGDWYIRSASGAGKVIMQDGGGNVGIGTANPLARLDVAGGVRCTTLDLTSDRAAKDGLRTVDEREVLDRLSVMPIATWHYKEAPAVRHIGPMAQDFRAAFGVGTDDKHISVVDGVGVSLAAIQGLHRELKDARAALTRQGQVVDQLRCEMAALRDRVLACRVDSGEGFDPQQRSTSENRDSNGAR